MRFRLLSPALVVFLNIGSPVQAAPAPYPFCGDEEYSATYEAGDCYCDCVGGSISPTACWWLGECPNGNGIYCTKKKIGEPEAIADPCGAANQDARWRADFNECGRFDNLFCNGKLEGPEVERDTKKCTVKYIVKCEEKKSADVEELFQALGLPAEAD